MGRTLVALQSGFEEIEAITVINVLRRGGVDVVTASLVADRKVLGSHSIPVEADVAIDDVAAEEFDAIVLPGGEGTPHLGECETLLKMLAAQNEAKRLICAICAAPALLTRLGLIDPEAHITCYPSCKLDLDRKCADAPVVQDGNYITGEAPGAAMLFALIVLGALTHPRNAERIGRGLVTDALEFE